jgi:hypothetical protein
MTRKNVPKKVAKKERPQTWDKKLKTLRKRYGSVPRKGRENTFNLHMPNVIAVGRLRSHVLTDRSEG